jgi:hypothetical protein
VRKWVLAYVYTLGLQTDQTPPIRVSKRNTAGMNKLRWFPRRQSWAKCVATNVQPDLKEEEEAPCQISQHQEGWNHEDPKEAGDQHWTNERLLWQTSRTYLLQESRSRRKHLKTHRSKQPKPLKELQNVENADMCFQEWNVVEIGKPRHEGVVEATKVCAILHVFSEDICRIHFTSNMLDGDRFILDHREEVATL